MTDTDRAPLSLVSFISSNVSNISSNVSKFNIFSSTYSWIRSSAEYSQTRSSAEYSQTRSSAGYLYLNPAPQIVSIKEDDVSVKTHCSFTNFDNLDNSLKKIYEELVPGSYQINGLFYYLCNDAYLSFYRIITISQISTISIKLSSDKILNDDFCIVGSGSPELFLEKIKRPMVHPDQENFRDYFLFAKQPKGFDEIKNFNDIRLSSDTTLVSVNKLEQVEFFKLEKEYTFKYETDIVRDEPIKICVQFSKTLL